MPLLLDKKNLSELMKHFYTLTGIRIVLFDENFVELLSYPESRSEFCSCIRSNENYDSLCRKSDLEGLKKCRSTGEIYIYKCHAGLIEVVAPIRNDGAFIGYVMFGQITDIRDKKAFAENMAEPCIRYRIDADAAKKIKYKSNDQIIAASKIMEALISYINLKEMVRPQRRRLFGEIEKYINENLCEKITVDDLCRRFGISRTRLYELFGGYIGIPIALYIKEKRLERAKELIKAGETSAAAADKCGFDDYNYFLRVFKKRYGVSPKKMKKEMK